ncbi:hypothetical protein K440DRAFT_151266 [Wilcoxina mikolae CBS 423.85]|nr:hypothetical protein K440DRAFT_151266 [Wilcoxina mikolae CBS 423.85]
MGVLGSFFLCFSSRFRLKGVRGGPVGCSWNCNWGDVSFFFFFTGEYNFGGNKGRHGKPCILSTIFIFFCGGRKEGRKGGGVFRQEQQLRCITSLGGGGVHPPEKNPHKKRFLSIPLKPFFVFVTHVQKKKVMYACLTA